MYTFGEKHIQLHTKKKSYEEAQTLFLTNLCKLSLQFVTNLQVSHRVSKIEKVKRHQKTQWQCPSGTQIELKYLSTFDMDDGLPLSVFHYI